MTFWNSVTTCLRKYATFSGKATRSELWYFYLLFVVCEYALVIPFLLAPLFTNDETATAHNIVFYARLILALIFLMPLAAVATRRLHDTGRTGRSWLVILIPLLGPILLFAWLVEPTKAVKAQIA